MLDSNLYHKLLNLSEIIELPTGSSSEIAGAKVRLAAALTALGIGGGGAVDLTPYALKADHVSDSELSTALASYVTNSTLAAFSNTVDTNTTINNALSNYILTADLPTLLSDYIDSAALATALSGYLTNPVNKLEIIQTTETYDALTLSVSGSPGIIIYPYANGNLEIDFPGGMYLFAQNAASRFSIVGAAPLTGQLYVDGSIVATKGDIFGSDAISAIRLLPRPANFSYALVENTIPSPSAASYAQLGLLLVAREDPTNHYFDANLRFNATNGSIVEATYSLGSEGIMLDNGTLTEYRHYLFDQVNNKTIYYIDQAAPTTFKFDTSIDVLVQGNLIITSKLGLGGANYGTAGNLLKSNGAATPPSWLDHTTDFLTQYARLVGRAGGQVLNGGTAASETLTLMSTAHATKGKLLFGTSAYDEVNNRLGINILAPLYQLHVYRSGAAAIASLTTEWSNSSCSALFQAFAYSNTQANLGGIFRGTASRGTVTTPTITKLDDILVSLVGDGFGNSLTTFGAGSVKVVADADWSSTAAPARIAFFTTPAATITPLERLRIQQDGNIAHAVASVHKMIGQNRFRYKNSMAAINRATDQAIATATATIIAFGDVVFDSDNMRDVGAQERLTIKLTGKYVVFASIQWEGLSGGNRYCSIRKNNTTTVSETNIPASNALGLIQTIACILDLVATDYITLQAYHDYGSNLNVIGSALTRLQVAYIGE